MSEIQPKKLEPGPANIERADAALAGKKWASAAHHLLSETAYPSEEPPFDLVKHPVTDLLTKHLGEEQASELFPAIQRAANAITGGMSAGEDPEAYGVSVAYITTLLKATGNDALDEKAAQLGVAVDNLLTEQQSFPAGAVLERPSPER